MKINNRQIVKFASVGVVNTAVDFALFALLYNVFDVHLLVANTASTGTALTTGFFLNSRYTFKNEANSKKIFAAYVAVTLVGLWILQPIIITMVSPVLLAHSVGYLNQDSAILLAKVLSIVVSMTWNYLWYSFVIFKRSGTSAKPCLP